jgi:hypothetical protein
VWRLILSFLSIFQIGAFIMKVSLIALVAGCAVASSAFAASDLPPVNPPHAAAFDLPPVNPPHAAAFDLPPVNPPHAAAFDLPPVNPPHSA